MIESFKTDDKQEEIIQIIKALRQIKEEVGVEVFQDGKKTFGMLYDLIPDCSILKLFEIAINDHFIIEMPATLDERKRAEFISTKCESSGLSAEAANLVLHVLDSVFRDNLTRLDSERPSSSSKLDECIRILNDNPSDLDKVPHLQILSKEATKGNAEAQYQLGKFLVTGKHVIQNVQKGIGYLIQAAQNKNINACKTLSEIYSSDCYVQPDFEESLYWIDLINEREFPSAWLAEKAMIYFNAGIEDRAFSFAQRAVNECPTGDAYLILGSFYEQGTGVSRNYLQAAKCYLEALDHGETQGYVNLAGLYSEGLGVSKDLSRAFRLLLTAAESGNPLGMNATGYYLENGIGTTQNLQAAAEFYKKGAVGGNPASAANLARLYLSGIGVNRDLDEAVRWLEEAASKNYPDAVKVLVQIYTSEEFKKNDRFKAKRYIEQLILLEPDNGMNYVYLGNLLQSEDSGAPFDGAHAIECYQRAADLGEPLGLNAMGVAYLNGKFIDLDVNKAISLFGEAYKAGCDEGAVNLAYILVYSVGKLTRNIRSAISILEKPAKNGHRRAQEYLGQIYFEGWAGYRDYEKAADYFSQAKEQGSQLANEYLEENYKKGSNGWKIKSGLFSKVRDPKPLPEITPFVPGKGGCTDCTYADSVEDERKKFCRKFQSNVFMKSNCSEYMK